MLVGSHLRTWVSGHGTSKYNCDAAMVIEAARDISLTGVRPRRSIRFVLFTGQEQDMPGSWGYVQSHRTELDHARAAIILGSRCLRINGYSLEGRSDIEPGVREAIKPIESMGMQNYIDPGELGIDDFDFIMEGVPTLGAFPAKGTYTRDSPTEDGAAATIAISEIKRDTAIAAVTAFGIAERADPIGPRLSRAEIESLLKTTGLADKMHSGGIWPLWESGARGRRP